MKANFYCVILILSLCALSCNKQQNIKGVIANADGELLALTRNTMIVDTVKLKEKGDFAFNFEHKNDVPVFLTLQTKDKVIANLLLEKNDKISIESDFKNASNYTVTGSKGSELLFELNKRNAETTVKLDSVDKIMAKEGATLDLERSKIRIITKYKQDVIRFIATNPTSLAAYMALYKEVANIKVFGVENDAIYFKVVADSLEKKYPKSQYVEQLKEDYTKLFNIRDMRNLIENAKEVELPSIKLQDQNNNEISLNDLKGKVVLLNFWASWDKGSTMDNMELLNIYDKYKNKNFEIYNISLDDSKDAWIKTISTQNLPWVNVFAGRESYIAGIYNVLKLPTSFLISEKGELIQRDIKISELDKKLSTVLK